jgi:hypothetical protein
MISRRRSFGVSNCRTAFRLPGSSEASNPWMSKFMWFVPRKVPKTSVIADVITPCAAGYSGWFGVVSSGRQSGCSAVAGFPSSKPGTGPNPSAITAAGSIAVTGRQKR